MLYEIKNIQQNDNEPRRRWFFNHEMDLYVWLNNDNNIIGFQLCYDKPQSPHALTWHQESGYQHNKIDDGEATGGFKGIRLLIPDGQPDVKKIILTFNKKNKNIPNWISTFICKKMSIYLD